MNIRLPLTTQAPAKINLTLAVLGRRADGYHLLESLVAFAGVGDSLSLTPAEAVSLSMSGPYALSLCAPSLDSSGLGLTEDNLVLRAARHVLALKPALRAGHFHLVKRLPVASGIGGGSADAAAALRLIGRLNGLAAEHSVLREAAQLTGSDVPVCLESSARIMSGAGEILGPKLFLPKLCAVLVNPGVPVATADVFAYLDMAKGSENARQDLSGSHFLPPNMDDASLLTRWLSTQANHLEAPAMVCAPLIGTALNALRNNPACRLARMSGSGATCFGIFDDCKAAANAAKSIKDRKSVV